MTKRRALLFTAVAGILVLCFFMPVFVFQVQDRQAQGLSVYTDEQSLSLKLTDGSSSTYWQRLELAGGGEFSTAVLLEHQMSMTLTEVQERLRDQLAPMIGDENGNLWLYPSGEEEAGWAEVQALGTETYAYLYDDVRCYYLWNESTDIGFRAWQFFLYQFPAAGGSYVSVRLDDTTGQLLSVFCWDPSGVSYEPYQRGMEITNFDDEALKKAEKLIQLFADGLDEEIYDFYLDTMDSTEETDSIVDFGFRAVYALRHDPDPGYGSSGLTYVSVKIRAESWSINVME